MSIILFIFMSAANQQMTVTTVEFPNEEACMRAEVSMTMRNVDAACMNQQTGRWIADEME